MWTEFICIAFGYLAGLATLLFIWIMSDKRKEKQRILRLYNAENWCYENCKISERCFGNHKDPYEALDELVNNYCINCPIGLAQEYVEKQVEVKKK